ncbi:PHB depolymerase family esterase [Cupriavidus necator]|uniref:extracellular catalytic domain type 1 short-chain-length polyhydroxyalkanoate depolymerase n=1 Tax=Cupriavidus necator TaxID=106590 RepID=UPI0039C16C7E
MDATLAVSQASPRRKPGGGRLGMLLLVLLLALPMTAHAQFFCSWFPFLCPKACSAPLTEVTNFGSNPGNLKMCTYLPPNLGASRPLVVALHGCTQQAPDYDDETGWIKFASKYRFALLLPQQQQANNSKKCFNWFEAGDNERDKGEALSIRSMIGKIVADAAIDPGRVYVTGLSAGGGMTAVMLATYPELFAGGAIIAGIPYKCANNGSEALGQCGVSLTGQLAPMKDLTPAAWGDLVRNASNHNGQSPRISIWQGTNDTTVNPVDQRELVDQWTNVLGIDQTPDGQDTINGHEHKLYKDSSGNVLVETVLVNGMGHGTPIEPGNADNQCGKVASFIQDAGICSSFHITKFWGIDSP